VLYHAHLAVVTGNISILVILGVRPWPTMVDVTVGESLFEQYLNQQHLTFEREPLVGGRKPDFLVDCQGRLIACEVYEPEIRLPREPDLDDPTLSAGGFMDSYTRLRNGFDDRKQDQIKAFSQAGLPVVLVVAETASDVPVDPVFMAGAMYGNLQVTFAVGPAAPDSPQATMGFGAGGRVQPQRRTGLSAVAVVKEFNLGEWQVERTIDRRLREMGLTRAHRPSEAQLAQAWETIAGAYAEAERSASIIRGARAVRLEVIHNPFAARPIGLDLLCGPYDRQWARFDGARGPAHMLVCEGYLAYQVGGNPLLAD
jgi:hypothetical protein